VVMSPARMIRRFLIDWAANLMRCVFMGDGHRWLRIGAHEGVSKLG
jgi:hypothetical protein